MMPINLSQILPDSSQPRDSLPGEGIARLAASIRERGLLLPLRVKPSDANGYHALVSGHRRLAALHELGAATAPCIVVDGPLDEAAILAEQMVENLLREDLSPIDEAGGYRRYMALRKVTAVQAAAELHVPASRISRALPLLELPDEVRSRIHAGTIPKETAYYLSRLPEGDDRCRLIAQALTGSLTRDAAARAARSKKQDAADAPSVSRVTCKLPDGRTLTLAGPTIRLETLIETLEAVLKDARKARTQGWDVGTLAKVFRDRSAAAGGAA